MDDEYFVAELYANDLLPGDLKNEIKSLTTSAKKATKFLDDVIQQLTPCKYEDQKKLPVS